jgi:hypothetical protein
MLPGLNLRFMPANNLLNSKRLIWFWQYDSLTPDGQPTTYTVNPEVINVFIRPDFNLSDKGMYI